MRLKNNYFQANFLVLALCLMAFIGGRWTDKTPPRLPIAMGFIVMPLSMMSFSYFAPLNASIIKAVLVQEIGIASSVFFDAYLIR